MAFPVAHETFQRISFTQPLYVRPGKFLQPYPNEESRVTALIRPYTSTVNNLWNLIFLHSVQIFSNY